MVIGVASALAQGGFVLATKSVKPSAAKLNPIKGAKRIFGPQAAWEGVKMLLKSSLVGLLVVRRDPRPDAARRRPGADRGDDPAARPHSALGLMRNIALAGLALAAADYAMQRRRVGKQTRMSKEEVKQEHKQTEGDPMLKGAIRARQLAASRNRMMADVATADVVLVNPTHVAVALRYESERAPRASWPAAPARSPPRSGSVPPRSGSRWSATSRSRGRSTPPRKVGQTIPHRALRRRRARCWRS